MGTSQPVDAHHLGQHGDVDGHRGSVRQAVSHAEGGQLREGGGQRAQEQHDGQDKDWSRQLQHLVGAAGQSAAAHLQLNLKNIFF